MPLYPTNTQTVQINEMMLIMDYGLPTQAVLGPTRGGGTLNIEPTYRPIEYDGAPSEDVMGMVVIDQLKATLEFTTLDWSHESIGKLFGFLTEDGDDLKLLPVGIVPTAKFLTNVTAFCKMTGGNYKQIQLKNVLGTGNLSAEAAPKAEGEVEVVLTAHYDPAMPCESPVVISEVASVASITECEDYAGVLDVTSTEGTGSGDTRFAVEQPNGFGKAFYYKLFASAATVPDIGDEITGYIILQQGADIAASSNQAFVVVEMGLDNIATRVGTGAIVKKS